MRFSVLAAVAVLSSLGAATAAGPDAFGRLALLAGWNGPASGWLASPGARGVALYRSGSYAEADEAFRAAGRTATYNRGLSLAALGDYAQAVAYFDAVLFADPADADARHNREVLSKLIAVVVGDSNAIDGVAAKAETGNAQAAASKRDGLEGAPRAEQSGLADTRVDRATAATEGWLATLPDEPGLYLKRRIEAEYRRRQDLGLANPPEATAW